MGNQIYRSLVVAAACFVATEHVSSQSCFLFLFVKQWRSLRIQGRYGGCLWHLPAQDYINQSIYFPRGARRKSLQIPVKLDNRRTGASRVTLTHAFFFSFFAHFANLMDLVLSNFVEQCVEEQGGGGGGGGKEVLRPLRRQTT